MYINIKIASMSGFLILLAISIIIFSHFQNALAFSFLGPLDKLFGGLFQKPSNNNDDNNKTKPLQSPTIQNLDNNSNTLTANISPLPSPLYLSSLTNLTVPPICHIMEQSLPDPKCTPGSINPSVNQNNIKNTVCLPGFSKSIRPPVSYTTPLKVNLMHSYGFTDSRVNYELDHLVPLEIGGNPKSVTNLWPEPGYGQYNFHIKDRFENYLHKLVCSGSMTLSEAQKEIATDWIDNWKKSGQP
jgi:hypothetical protein